MSKPTYDELVMALHELHQLIGVSMTLKERKTIRDAAFAFIEETLKQKIGTGWLIEPGPIAKAVEECYD